MPEICCFYGIIISSFPCSAWERSGGRSSVLIAPLERCRMRSHAEHGNDEELIEMWESQRFHTIAPLE